MVFRGIVDRAFISASSVICKIVVKKYPRSVCKIKCKVHLVKVIFLFGLSYGITKFFRIKGYI